MTISHQTIAQLKIEDHMFVAGAMAFSLGYQRESYGCHFGMRSTVDKDRNAYRAGWEAALSLSISGRRYTEMNFKHGDVLEVVQRGRFNGRVGSVCAKIGESLIALCFTNGRVVWFTYDKLKTFVPSGD